MEVMVFLLYKVYTQYQECFVIQFVIFANSHLGFTGASDFDLYLKLAHYRTQAFLE